MPKYCSKCGRPMDGIHCICQLNSNRSDLQDSTEKMDAQSYFTSLKQIGKAFFHTPVQTIYENAIRKNWPIAVTFILLYLISEALYFYTYYKSFNLTLYTENPSILMMTISSVLMLAIVFASAFLAPAILHLGEADPMVVFTAFSISLLPLCLASLLSSITNLAVYELSHTVLGVGEILAITLFLFVYKRLLTIKRDDALVLLAGMLVLFYGLGGLLIGKIIR